jgi:hypothetical protein
MSDGRWIDVSAMTNFRNAVEIYRRGGLDEPGLDGYERSGAFQFAVQSGYTAAEAAMKRIMDILKEEHPTGEDSHKDLVVRLSRSRTDEYARPALLPPDVSKDLLETMRARHRARHFYDDFDIAKAKPSVDAIERLVTSLPVAVVNFRNKVDPEPTENHDGGGDGAGGGTGGGP